jgi:hypothetical protein
MRYAIALLLVIACHLQAQPQPTSSILLGAHGSSASFSVVQQATCTDQANPNVCTSLGSNPSTSDVLVYLGGNYLQTISSVSSTGATWSKLGSSTTNRDAEIWCATLSGTPGTAVSINLTSYTSSSYGVVAELAGVTCSQIGSAQTTTSSSNATITTGSITTTGAALILAVDFNGDNPTLSSGPTNSFTAFSKAAAQTNAAYLVVSTAGTYSTGWTISAAQPWDTVLVALAL